MNNILVVKSLPSSFVSNDMKISSETGAGEAKLFVGSKSKEEEFNSFFEFDSGYRYKFDKENLITYINQVKLEYAFQKINKYKKVSIKLWEQNYKKIEELSEEDLFIDLKNFIDRSRYYVRAENEIFKKLLRNIAIPKLTNIIFEKNKSEKIIYITLQINLEVNADEKKNSWIISANPKMYNHELCFKEQGFIEWGQNIKCNVNDIIYIYMSKPSGKIKYKVRVEKKDIKYSDLEIKKNYWLTEEKEDNTNKKYMKLILEDTNDSDELTLEKMKKYAPKLIVNSPTDLSKEPKLLKYIESVFNRETIEIEDYTEEQLADILKSFSNNSKYTKNSGIQLFGIKYGALINLKGYNKTEIVKKAGLNDSYNTELSKGIALGEFVQMKDDNEVLYKIVPHQERVETVKYEDFKTGYNSKYSRNRIIFGAPGTGKSFSLNEESKDLLKDGNEENYERVTFHPDYSYANFVGTYKPVPYKNEDGKNEITYEYVPGPFMRLFVKAIKNSRTDNIKPYLLIIEEINRADVAAVFGDVFQLLDRDENNVSEYPIEASEDIKKYLAKELGGESQDYNKIYIPDNMFIWATMNSADQGVYPLDTAFKRRWDFKYIGIDENEEKISERFVILGKGDKSRKVEWNKLRKAINDKLISLNVNEDKLLGPYFLSEKIIKADEKGEIDKEKFITTFKSKILMYLFEDAAKQKRKSLFKDNTKYSSICNEFDEQGVYIFDSEISSQFNDDKVEENQK